MQPVPFDDSRDPAPACAGGLLAGTLALMTCWAAPEHGARLDAEQQRALMARKIVANLQALGMHPGVPPGLRAVIGKVHARWDAIALGAAALH